MIEERERERGGWGKDKKREMANENRTHKKEKWEKKVGKESVSESLFFCVSSFSENEFLSKRTFSFRLAFEFPTQR